MTDPAGPDALAEEKVAQAIRAPGKSVLNPAPTAIAVTIMGPDPRVLVDAFEHALFEYWRGGCPIQEVDKPREDLLTALRSRPAQGDEK